MVLKIRIMQGGSFEALDKVHCDESVRALPINAKGKVFSADGDLTGNGTRCKTKGIQEFFI